MIDYEFKDLFNQDSVEKQITITYDNTTITNEDLFNNEMTIEESLCSESQLKFGSCESSMVKFKVANIFSPMIGKTLDIKTVLEGNTENPFRYGFYKVQSDKPTADRVWREIVAYDAMYDIINTDVTDWYNSILPDNKTSVTLKQFRTDFCDRFGLKEENAVLANDNMIVKRTISVQSDQEENENTSTITEKNGLSGLKVISAICEINGCFGHIGRDGKMHYIYLPQDIQGLYPANDLYPDDNLYPADFNGETVNKSHYISCKYEDYECKKIDKLQIRQEENDIGAIVGDDGNTYVIEGNFLVYGKNAKELNQIAENIFEKIKDVSYRPFEAECVGNPCIEVGDAVRLPTTYQIVESYVLKRTLKGIQALRDSYSSTGSEMFGKSVNSIQASILSLKGKTNRLERTVEETISTITDLEEQTESQIRQTASSILTTVASAEAEKTWDISGYYIEYYGYGNPQEEHEASEEYAGKYYLDQDTGQLYICAIISVPGGNAYYWQPTTILPLVTAQLNSKIEQTSSAISAEVTRAIGEETSLSGRINVTANDITAEVTRATGSENALSSRIQITEDNISSKVSKGDVVSEINQSPDTIELSSGRLVITSENFSLDSSGNVSITGNVNATSGSIGPFTITNNGLEWEADGANGTKIWSNTIKTGFLAKNDNSDALRIGTDGEETYIGPYGYASSVPRNGVFIGGDIHLEKDRYLMRELTSLIGWSSFNNIHIGDYNRTELPNTIALNSKKVQAVNASGSLVDIVDNTSDEREKDILSQIDQKSAVDFIKNLVPIAYQYKAESNPVTHWGFGAQTTLAAMMDSGIGESRLIARNPYILDTPVNPDDDTTFFYSMKNDELAAPYAAALQYILNELQKIKDQIGGY